MCFFYNIFVIEKSCTILLSYHYVWKNVVHIGYVNMWIDLQHLCNLLKLGCNQTMSVLLIALNCIDNAVTTESIKRLRG